MSQYVHKAWGPEQGFSGKGIFAISRSPDGFLWIGTDRGLVRFDGNTFELIRQPIASLPPIGRVRGLACDAQGTLWILLEGAHLLLYRNGKFTDAFTELNLHETTFTAMSLDQHANALLTGLGNVTLRAANGRLETVANAESVAGTVTSITESLDQRIWMGTRDNGLFSSDHGRMSNVPQVLGDSKINALASDFNGGVWIGTDRGIYLLSPEGILKDPLPAWVHRHQILTIFRDRDACIWAGSDTGLIRITPGFQASFRESAEAGEVNAVFQDGEGNLWFGGTGGLERLQEGVFFNYSSAEGVPAVPMGPIFADRQGAVWFAPLSGGLYCYRGGQVGQVRQDGLDRDVIYSIDGVGEEIWVGRQTGGLTRIRRAGDSFLAQTFRQKQGLAQNSVYALHVSADGTVWAGTVSGGLSVLGRSGFKTYTAESGLSSNSINSITESPDGRVWIATSSGVDEFNKGRWIHWTAKNGLPFQEIRLCFADSKGVIWLASSDGLSYLSGDRVVALANLPNLAHEQILGIAEDHAAFLWLSTADHVFRVKRNTLLTGALRSGDLQSYGMADGLAAVATLRRERSMVTDSSGRIWVSLSRGIACGDPQLTERDSMPIQVRIDSLIANGSGVALNQQTRLPSGTRSMTLHYASDSLFAPERVRYRYRLEGTGADWSDAVGWRQVLYDNLGPGDYHFHVIASRDGSLWNSAETVYSFSIDPSYWQTWWFRFVAVLAASLIVLFIGRQRSTRLARQLNARFQERLSERTRIAQELHDTLLQSFQGLMLRFQTVANLLPQRPADAKVVLEEALDRADGAILEGRNAIQNIRTSNSRDTNLAESINSLMAELVNQSRNEESHPPSYTVVVEGTPRVLHPEVHAEVLRIAQECLRNACRHSRANHIETELKFESSHFRIRFRDDGVGIDPEVLKKGSRSGHWGMIGMKERASRIGAKLELWSKPGAGTELDLSVPSHIAYDRARIKGGLRSFRKRFEDPYELHSNTDSDR